MGGIRNCHVRFLVKGVWKFINDVNTIEVRGKEESSSLSIKTGCSTLLKPSDESYTVATLPP